MAVKGVNLVAKNIERFAGRFLKHVNNTMDEVRGIMDKEVTKNISLTDHSLKDLREMGHPYSRKSNAPPHSPHWQVHKQSGTLLKNKYSQIKFANVNTGVLEAGAYIGVNEAEAPYAASIVWGSSKMIPRDFLTGSLNNIKKEAYKHIKSNLAYMVRQFNLRKTEQSAWP